jgi:hypothetical protein
MDLGHFSEVNRILTVDNYQDNTLIKPLIIIKKCQFIFTYTVITICYIDTLSTQETFLEYKEALNRIDKSGFLLCLI